VLQLMTKHAALLGTDEEMGLVSVTDSKSKGYIYIEARNDGTVKECIRGLRGIFMHKTSILPLKERPDVMRISSAVKPLKAGNYVRMSRKPYKGDLAKVVRVLNDGARVIVLVVPRIDFVNNTGLTREQIKEKLKKNPIPPQQPFNANDIMQTHGEHYVMESIHPVTGDDVHVYYENYFKGGFLMLEVSSRLVRSKNVTPTLEELKWFMGAGESAEVVQEHDRILDKLGAEASAALGEKSEASKTEFSVGDSARVVGGDLMGLRGTVRAVRANDIEIQISEGDLKGEVVGFDHAQLAKAFNAGTHVRVKAGRHAGQTGHIVSIDDSASSPQATIFTDLDSTEITVFCAHLVESAEIAVGHEQLGGIKRFDFVMLTGSRLATVFHVGQSDLGVLDQNGSMTRVKPSEIRGKKRAAAISAKDAQRNPVSVSDRVKIVSGKYQNVEAIVKHIHRNVLWVHSHMVTQNGGLLVLRGKEVKACGTRFKREGALLSKKAKFKPDMMMRPRMGMNSNSRVGKYVVVQKGVHKGLKGSILSQSGDKVSVQLSAKLMNVTVKLSDTLLLEGAGGSETTNRGHSSFGGQNQSQDFGWAAQHAATPGAIGAGIHTPFGATPGGLGGNTPRYGGNNTPGYGGGSTPFGGATPFGSTTPFGGATPGGATPRNEDGDNNGRIVKVIGGEHKGKRGRLLGEDEGENGVADGIVRLIDKDEVEFISMDLLEIE